MCLEHCLFKKYLLSQSVELVARVKHTPIRGLEVLGYNSSVRVSGIRTTAVYCTAEELENVVVSGLCHSCFRVEFIKGKGVFCCTYLWLGCYKPANAIPANSLQVENASFVLCLLISTRHVCAGVLWLFLEEVCSEHL